MICPACSSDVPLASRFCPACGRRLTPSELDTRTPTDQGADHAFEVHDRRFQPGDRIGTRYRIVSALGAGGMGEVFRADDLTLGESVALKFLPEAMAADPEALDRLRHEVRLARGVTHRHVCRIHDIGEANGQVFISMEYVDGEDLSHVLTRMGRLTHEKAVEIARQLCQGLGAAHDAGIIHRDLKPANIMIDGRGYARIMDFGIAGLGEASDSIGTAGTPAYMAPELFTGSQPSARTDLYALGLVLYEIFTGRRARPHAAPTARSGDRPTSDAPPTPSSLIPDIDPTAEDAILRCLDDDPDRRPTSARELLRLLPGGDPLAAALAAGETPSPEMVAAAGDEGAFGSRTRRLVALAAIVGLIAVWWGGGATGLADRIDPTMHPAVLASEARRMLEAFGYTEPPADSASGFVLAGADFEFWYRQRPTSTELFAGEFYRDWAQFSYARPTMSNPAWTVPGEAGASFATDGTLRWFRAIPTGDGASTDVGDPAWSYWFPPELVGVHLDALESVRGPIDPPPDAFDALAEWRGRDALDAVFHIQAAAYRGRPVYFRRVVDDLDPAGGAAGAGVQAGRDAIIYLYLLFVLGAAALAWRNLRSGRTDRRGALRAAGLLFAISMLAWLFLAPHRQSSSGTVGSFEIGLAQSLLRAAVFWVWYSALEPFVRRIWPQTLITWTRLLDRRWRDPLVGRDLLVGVLLGSLGCLIYQSQVLLPPVLGLEPWRLVAPNVVALAGAAALVGSLFEVLTQVIWQTLFGLLFLLGLRFVFHRTVWMWILYLLILTPILYLASPVHPVLGWAVVAVGNVVFLWTISRFGFLAAIVSSFTGTLLLSSPITTDLSAWYAGNGLLALGLVAALGGYGYYASQHLLGIPSGATTST